MPSLSLFIFGMNYYGKIYIPFLHYSCEGDRVAAERDMILGKAEEIEKIEQELEYHEAKILTLRRKLNNLVEEVMYA